MTEPVRETEVGPPTGNYETIDFKKNSILYALKAHNPPRNLYHSNVSPSLIKECVLNSPRIKQVIREVSDDTSTCYGAKHVLKQRWWLRIWLILWKQLI